MFHNLSSTTVHYKYCAFAIQLVTSITAPFNINIHLVLFGCVGRQAPISGLCADDGGNSEFLAQAKANSAVFCNFPTECTKVHGKPEINCCM